MSTQEAQSKTVTLFGGRTVSVQFADGSTADILVRQLPLRDYDNAFKVADDEQALTALICGKAKDWLYGATPETAVTPESYEVLRDAAQEVNAKGFFAYAERRQTQLAKRLSSLSPDVLKMAAQSVNASSPTSPQRLRPMPG